MFVVLAECLSLEKPQTPSVSVLSAISGCPLASGRVAVQPFPPQKHLHPLTELQTGSGQALPSVFTKVSAFSGPSEMSTKQGVFGPLVFKT